MQQYVDNGDAKVALWLPGDWVLHVWSLTNPSGALSHAMDVQTGRQVVVQLYSCGEDERDSWASGEKAEMLLGSQADAIAPADEQTAQLMPDSGSFVTTTKRDSLTYSGRAFFAVRSGRCYVIQLISTEGDFEGSLDTFSAIAKDMRFRED